MTQDTTRRALLAGTAAIGTDTLMPYARPARALPALGADAELLRLGILWEASAARCRAADKHLDEVSAGYVSPHLPEAMCWRPADDELWESGKLTTDEFREGHPDGRSYIHATTIAGMRIALEQLKGSPPPFLGDRIRTRRTERLEEILGAHDDWYQRIRKTWDAAGLPAAERANEAAHNEAKELRRRIMACRANTWAGVQVKVKAAAFCFGETPSDVEQFVAEYLEGEEPSGEVMAVAILPDLVRLMSPAVGGA